MFEKKGDLFGVHQKAAKQFFSVDEYIQSGLISRFIFEMSSDSLVPYIQDKDLLVVDRAMTPENGDYILASLNGVFVCRRFEIRDKQNVLVCKDRRVSIGDEDQFLVFGVIVSTVRKFK